MDKEYLINTEVMKENYIATEDVHDVKNHANPDNSISKAALIAYLLS